MQVGVISEAVLPRDVERREGRREEGRGGEGREQMCLDGEGCGD